MEGKIYTIGFNKNLCLLMLFVRERLCIMIKNPADRGSLDTIEQHALHSMCASVICGTE